MELNLKGKRALVTASGRGIGRAVALDLAREGAKVAVVSRTESDIRSLIDEMGGNSKGHFGDVVSLVEEGAPSQLVKKLKEHFGDVDVLVNNLGDTLEVRDPFCTLEDWRRVWRINLEVAVELNQLLLPYMRERKWGRIVNMASTASLENNGPVPYCTSKAALAAYTRSMGRVLAPDGVVMSAVVVGAIFTEGGVWERFMVERPEHVQKYVADRLPLKRFGKPEDIAHMVSFLSSDLAEFCQGAIVPVDGGQSRHYFGQ